MRHSGQCPQPAAASGGGVGHSRGGVGVRRAAAMGLAGEAVAGHRAHGAAGLGRAGRGGLAQPGGVPAVVRAVSNGGGLEHGAVGLIQAVGSS